MTITQAANRMQPDLKAIREQLHLWPEISRQEVHTAAFIQQELLKIGGYRLTTGVAGNGIIAELEGAEEGPVVALRADMDALQITEQTDLACCSQQPGVMHACGHDMHMTMLLGAARLLAERRSELRGTVRLIFQPAEELSPTGGSQGMIEAGALKDAAAVFGLHVWPQLPAGVFGFKAGPLMAASDHFSVTIEGKPCHAATPQEGVDALVAGAQFVTAAQTIISRNTDPLKSAVITIGRCMAGTRYNIVAGSCELEGTCRTFDPDVRDLAERRLDEVLQGVCMLSGCTGRLDYQRGYMAVMNDEVCTDYAQKTAAALFGPQEAQVMTTPSMCAEDFAFYLKHVPGCFAWIGSAKTEPAAPLHNSCFDPEESILWKGAALLAQLALGYSAR